MNIEDEMELMFYMQNSKEMPNPMKLYFDDTNMELKKLEECYKKDIKNDDNKNNIKNIIYCRSTY